MRSRSLIMGGTGTLGKALAKRLFEEGHDVRIVSRDEFKIYHMKKNWPQFEYGIGDIRDRISIERYFAGCDNVFHCAALKQVDMGEKFPHEFAKTNYFGTVNVVDLAIEYGAQNFVFFSTDKAVLPINAYGQSKALAESYIKSLWPRSMNMKIYRWGNILGSRGSVLPVWKHAMQTDQPIDVTDPAMTRFWLTIDTALDFVMETYLHCPEDIVQIPDMKASRLTALIDALAKSCDCSARINVVGPRPGEKIHETIYTSHKYCIRSDTSEQFTVEELIDLIRRCGI